MSRENRKAIDIIIYFIIITGTLIGWFLKWEYWYIFMVIFFGFYLLFGLIWLLLAIWGRLIYRKHKDMIGKRK